MPFRVHELFKRRMQHHAPSNMCVKLCVFLRQIEAWGGGGVKEDNQG